MSAKERAGDERSALSKFLDKYPYLPAVLAFAAVYLIFFIRLDFRPVFSDTILTGGDNASWYQSLKHLSEVLLPHGRLCGWTQSNFFGYNEFQYYFVLPFLPAVLLGKLIPLTVALKIATLLGVLATPPAFYYAVKKFTKNANLASAAVLLSLVFVFNPCYYAFGGNMLSLLIGEFCYSYALVFALFFMGALYSAVAEDGSPWAAGILLGLTGLSHAFVFLFAALVPVFFLVAKKLKVRGSKLFDGGDTFKKTAIVYLTAFLLMAFWVVPMIAAHRYAFSIFYKWPFKNFLVRIGMTGEWALIPSIALAVVLVLRGGKDRRLRGAFYLYMYAAVYFLYFASGLFGMIDVRFLPLNLVVSFFVLFDFLGFVLDLAKDKPRFDYRPFLLLIALAGSALFVGLYGASAARNFARNYSGYEATPDYAAWKNMTFALSGTINDGRILTEEFDPADDKSLGSPHAFDNVYLFTGRPSGEGIHCASTFMEPQNAYLYSEFSPAIAPNGIGPICSRIDFSSLPARFYQLNARDVIAWSRTIKNLFDRDTNFVRTGTYGRYSVYQYRYFPHSYVQVVPWERISVVDDRSAGFGALFLRQFRDYPLADRYFVPGSFSAGLPEVTRFTNYDAYRSAYIAGEPSFFTRLGNYAAFSNAVTGEDVGEMRIAFSTAALGLPHVIKVAYSPNFRSANGEKIYPVSPGFMMIVPKADPVVIEFRRTPAEIAGGILTLLLIPLLFLRKKIDALEPAGGSFETAAVGLFLAGVVVLIAVSAVTGRGAAERAYYRARSLYREGRAAEALDELSAYATYERLDGTEDDDAVGLLYLKADILWDLGRKAEANAIRQYLHQRYPYRR